MKKRFVFFLILLPVALSALNSSGANIKPILRKISPALIPNTITQSSVSICALRVSFQEDDNEATTGTGQFLDSGTLPCGDFPEIDPPPHNNAYFKDHIRALANYYSHASNGKLEIDTLQSEVFPLDDSISYQLSRKMEYYHPFLQEDSVDIRLAELFVEAVQLADLDTNINFSQYDVVVVFHAGVGQDFDLFLDPTPYDIPSAYLNSNDLTNYFTEIGETLNGFPVDRGLILPESQNHLFYPNWEDVFGGASIPCDYQIGLNGTFAFMMGFYLGLPGLYNTETGATGVGKFGLMDQGSANLNGLVPSYPSAWEREFMGWDTPVIAQGFNDIKLNHAESGSDTTLWKIPINDNEYFLIENRYSHVRPGVTLDSIQYKLYLDTGEKDWPALLPLIVNDIGAKFSSRDVMLSLPHYDVGLPGSGLLIWHIDESVIDANLATNSINVDREHRGVDLEEADGAQDLGYESQMIGASVDIGWYFDPWFAGNEGFWHLNPDYPEDDEKRIGFTGFTNPSSKSNGLAYTGIVVDSIGPSEAVMTFRIKSDFRLEGFEINWNLRPNERTLQLTLLPVNFDTSDPSVELLATWNWKPSYYYSFDESGTEMYYDYVPFAAFPAVINVSNKNYLIGFQRNTPTDTLDIWEYEITETGEITTNYHKQIIGNRVISNRLSYNDRLIFCTVDDQTDNYYLIAYFPEDDSTIIEQIDFPVYRIISDNSSIYTDSPDGVIMSIDPATLEPTTLIFDVNPGIQSMGLANINENQNPDLVAVHPERLTLILDIREESQKIITFDGEFDSTLAFSDIDGDGKVEIITTNSSKIYVFNEKLYLEANFPITIPNQYIGKTFQPNVLTTDIDGDQILDIIVTLEDVGILAYNFHGGLIDGFPRALPNSVTEQSVLMENENGIFIVTSNSAGTDIVGLYLTDEPLSVNAWYCFGGDMEHSFHYPIISQGDAVTSGGLLDQKKTFNWPNPTKFDRTAIRYFPTADCNISIDIYDLAGDFITSFKDSDPLINDYNEIEWNVGNIANGVYFAVVKATSGSKTESKIVKIMVIH
ncbi:MAG: T9SS type A sorting domain-containing protein [Candidatus Marinimicrobia bacterium]|nr:T9SS type A sorting domain-containing protein [Candidatus Neomarinimicrobiota bacterium]